MSSWSDAEVDELQRKGNDYARRTWLKNAPVVGSGGRPKEGDHIDVFKRFVVDAYERKRYYGEDDGQQQQEQMKSGVATAIPISQAAPVRSTPKMQLPPTRISAPVPTRKAPVPAPAPVADLLDFSAAAQTAPATFQANFDAFQPAPATSTSPQTKEPSFADFKTAGSDPFSVPPPAPAPATTKSAFGFISPPPAAAPKPAPVSAPSVSSNNDFADFSGLSLKESPKPTLSSVSTSQTMKKPVMSSQPGSSEKASLISAMNMPSSTSQQQFGNPMQQSNFGMMPQQMMMSQQNFGMQQQQMMMMQQQQQMMMQQNMMGMNNNYMGMNAGYNSNMNSQTTMNFGQGNSNKVNSNVMDSLQMNMSSMSAWTNGGSKK